MNSSGYLTPSAVSWMGFGAGRGTPWDFLNLQFGEVPSSTAMCVPRTHGKPMKSLPEVEHDASLEDRVANTSAWFANAVATCDKSNRIAGIGTRHFPYGLVQLTPLLGLQRDLQAALRAPQKGAPTTSPYHLVALFHVIVC